MIEFEGRRLTGANFFMDEPVAVIDTVIPAGRVSEVIESWQSAVESLHQHLKNQIFLYSQSGLFVEYYQQDIPQIFHFR